MNQNNIPKGQLSTIILSTLFSGDKYGYEIINEIKNKTDGQLVIKQPSLYSSLSRMEKQNLISSYWTKSDIGGKRHYYSITDFGKKQFEQMENSFYSSQEKITNYLENNNDSENSPKKYDDIGGFQKSDEQILIQKNENAFKNQLELEKEINLQATSTSFAENLRTTKPQLQSPAKFILKELEEETINIPTETQNIQKVEISDILAQEFKTNKTENFEEYDKLTDIDFTEKNENDSRANYSQNINLENSEVEKPINDDGVFIEEKYEPENIPKVKKLNVVSLSNNDNAEVSKKLNPNNMECGYTEKINALYNKTKNINEKKFVNNDKTSTYNELQEYYKNMNIKLSIHNQKFDKKPEQNVASNKLLFKKYLFILIVVSIETLLSFLTFSLFNLPISYSFLYFITPLLFCVLPIYYFVNNKKNLAIFDSKKNNFVYNLLIFVVGLVLLYSLNMLIGMNYLTILNYATTYIYPSILMTNILLGGLIDIKYLNKK
ncbi:MAG: PadR family transcriptional regulator [Clostridia bacterium]|nr:PadR family transcriptional regulator [Clostridia bacterium]